ncbi:YnfA family protein [Staphylococcus sp. NRL 19/737]|nr:YnfA family protein [Staphylococcus sp. NRL 19/737]MCJ1667457.1 YnfA family protein [Staphylococcus sp. NRL 19/737]
MLYSIFIFLLAGFCEIGGGYLIWLWLREGQSGWLGFIGGVILMMYGIIATFQSFPTFGRVYAAYGGVFIVMSIVWAYVIDKQAPDKYDLIGALICIIGILVMVLSSRA